jgi:hypothetical protein
VLTLLLAKKSAGLRPEIRDSLNLPPGGELTRNLDIASATPFDRGANTRNEISYWPDRQLTSRIPDQQPVRFTGAQVDVCRPRASTWRVMESR